MCQRFIFHFCLCSIGNIEDGRKNSCVRRALIALKNSKLSDYGIIKATEVVES